MIIKRILESDSESLEQMQNIEKDLLNEHWSKEEIKQSIQYGAVYFAALDGETIIGHCGMTVASNEGYITNMAVKEEYQQKGTGTAIMYRLLEHAKENLFSFVSLEVRKSNYKAIRFYNNIGFVQVGERKKFYTNPDEPALIMTYYLNNK